MCSVIHPWKENLFDVLAMLVLIGALALHVPLFPLFCQQERNDYDDSDDVSDEYIMMTAMMMMMMMRYIFINKG